LADRFDHGRGLVMPAWREAYRENQRGTRPLACPRLASHSQR